MTVPTQKTAGEPADEEVNQAENGSQLNEEDKPAVGDSNRPTPDVAAVRSMPPLRPRGFTSRPPPPREEEAQPVPSASSRDADNSEENAIENSSIPPDALPSNEKGNGDPFSAFEGELAGESTHIDADEILEQSTNILEGAPEPPYLEVEMGSDLGKQFVLNLEGETGVGRGIDNDVILTDVAVSRRHLRISIEGNSIFLRDLGSGNGTRVNGERVFDIEIRDDDRISLGETVLVMRVPSVSNQGKVKRPSDARVHAHAHEPKREQLPVALSSMPPGAPSPSTTIAVPLTGTDFIPALSSQGITQWIPRPQAGNTQHTVVLPRSWIIGFLVMGILFAVLLGATLTALLLKRESTVSFANAVSSPDSLFEAAVAAYNEKRWDDAQNLFQQLLSDHPGDGRVMRYMQQIQEAKEHEPYLVAARTALRAGDALTSLNEANRIPTTSPLSGDAEAIRLAARAKQVSDDITEARAFIQQGKLNDARRKVADALRLDPNHPTAKILETQLVGKSSASSVRNATKPASTASTTSPTNTPKVPVVKEASKTERTSGPKSPLSEAALTQQKKIMTVYRAGNFSAAAGLARAASTSGSFEEKQFFTRLAEDIDRFAAYYGRIRAAGTNLSSVLRQMHTAITLDVEISGGYYAKQLRPPLVESYLNAANRGIEEGRWPLACQKVRQAAALDSKNSVAFALGVKCGAQAHTMLKQAASLEKSDSAKAQSIYREILTMISQSSDAYKQAYKRLQTLSAASPPTK